MIQKKFIDVDCKINIYFNILNYISLENHKLNIIRYQIHNELLNL